MSNSGTQSVKPGPINYYHVYFNGNSYNVFSDLNGQTFYTQFLTIHSSDSAYRNINNGNIHVTNDFSVTGYGFSGSAVVHLLGSGTFTSASTGYTGHIVFNSSGTYLLSGSFTFLRDYTWLAGVIDPGTAVLSFQNPDGSNSPVRNIIPGNFTYYHVRFNSGGYGTNHSLNGGTLNTQHLTLSSNDGTSRTINNGTINTAGDITLAGEGAIGSVVINAVGTGTITGVSSANIPNFVFNSAGTYTISGNLKFYGNYTYAAGTINFGNSTFIFSGPSYSGAPTLNIIPGNISYNNVQFGWGSAYGASQSLGGGTMNVQNLTLYTSDSPTRSINNGTIKVNGNLASYTGGASGTLVIEMTGSNPVTIYQNSSTARIPNGFYINKTGGAAVTLISNINLGGTSQSLNLAGGTIDMAGFNLTVQSNMTLNGNTITKNAGILTVGGTAVSAGTFYGGTVAP
jgi:hypothetical protein